MSIWHAKNVFFSYDVIQNGSVKIIERSARLWTAWCKKRKKLKTVRQKSSIYPACIYLATHVVRQSCTTNVIYVNTAAPAEKRFIFISFSSLNSNPLLRLIKQMRGFVRKSSDYLKKFIRIHNTANSRSSIIQRERKYDLSTCAQTRLDWFLLKTFLNRLSLVLCKVLKLSKEKDNWWPTDSRISINTVLLKLVFTQLHWQVKYLYLNPCTENWFINPNSYKCYWTKADLTLQLWLIYPHEADIWTI